MDWEKIRKLIEGLTGLLQGQGGAALEEIEVQEGDLRIRVRRGGAAGPAAPAGPPAAVTAPPGGGRSSAAAEGRTGESAAAEAGLVLVRSPIVGTFYSAPSPGAPDFVRAGDSVAAGQVLCIVEAMKLMNEIEAEAAGRIVERLVQSGQPVEYGQPLFSIRPEGRG